MRYRANLIYFRHNLNIAAVCIEGLSNILSAYSRFHNVSTHAWLLVLNCSNLHRLHARKVFQLTAGNSIMNVHIVSPILHQQYLHKFCSIR
jgi:peroxiredoxin